MKVNKFRRAVQSWLSALRSIPFERMFTLAVMFVFCTLTILADGVDYTAGTTAISTVTEQIAMYVPIVVKLCYAIAGVVAVVGAISVYINMFFAPTKPLKIQSI